MSARRRRDHFRVFRHFMGMALTKTIDAPKPRPDGAGNPAGANGELAIYEMAINQHALVSKTDFRGRIIYVNEKFCEISKYSCDELIGRDHKILNSGYHTKEFMAELWRAIRDGKPWHGTIRNRAKDGTLYWVQSSIFPILRNGGDGPEYLSIRTHIPDLQRAKEEAEDASRAKSAFLATMSHELRTPMNGVLGAAAVLQKMNLTPEMREFVDIIADSGGLLMSLLNDILDVLKFQAGKVVLEETDFSLRKVVRKAAAVHALKASEKNLRFNVEIDSGVADDRRGDPHKITQILHNLLSNAVKFTESGSVQLTVGGAGDPGGDPLAVAFAISDSGIGMPKDFLAGAFTPFSQADSSTTRRFGGTGLGLSIVKNIVDAMKGELYVDSTVGEGTTFHFVVPLAVISEKKGSECDGVGDALTPGAAGASILIADDNRTNTLILEAFLKRAGAEMTVARNGLEAVEAYKSRRFDIVLMDINMPLMDGEQALHAIRRFEKEHCLKATPVVAVSADVMPDQVGRFLEIGFSAHLPKPVSEKSLLNAVAAIQQSEADARANPAASRDRKTS